MWMCDKPIPQQNLANELAELFTSLPGAIPTDMSKNDPNDNVAIWFSASWEVIAGQWTEIDVLRLEKFLLLVRRLFAAHLRWVQGKGWAEERQDKVLQVLGRWPFDAEGDLSKVPLGLRLHILDVWVDEMEKVGMLEDEAQEEQDETVERARQFAVRFKTELVEPLTGCAIKGVRKNAREELDDDRLPWNKGKGRTEEDVSDGNADGGNDEWDGFGD